MPWPWRRITSFLHLALRRCGQAGQNSRRRIGGDVVDRDEVGRPLLKLLLQRLRRSRTTTNISCMLVARCARPISRRSGARYSSRLPRICVATCVSSRVACHASSGIARVVDRGVPLGHFMNRLWHDCFRDGRKDNARPCVQSVGLGRATPRDFVTMLLGAHGSAIPRGRGVDNGGAGRVPNRATLRTRRGDMRVASERCGGRDLGAGLAGLTVALSWPGAGRWWCWPSASSTEAATAWAQGGIVGVLGSDDSVDSHVRDTQDAGAGLVDEHTARFIAEQSAAAVQWLVDQGVPFSPDPSGPLGLHLTREGGHTVRRIAHAADATGRAIHEVLLAKARKRIRTSRCASAGWRSTSSPRAISSAPRRALLRRLCAGHRRAPRRDAAGVGCGAGHRRRRQGLPLHHAIPTPPPATASRWPGAPAAASATWSSSSSTRPACTTLRNAAS